MVIGRAKRVEALLDWNTVCTKLAWGPVFILGGGYALAEAFEVRMLTCSFSPAILKHRRQSIGCTADESVYSYRPYLKKKY